MVAELGHFALIVALVVAAVQATVPLIGAARGADDWVAVARPAAGIQFLMAAVAFFALMYCFVQSDFSVATVFQSSHSLKPLLYKVTGVWGNHEGSLLLWILILTGFGAAVATFGTNLPPALAARVLSVQAMVGVGFLAFILFTSNPFERIFPAPAEGRGLNPLLQDPGLAIHPPFLYLGYVGFSMAFSFAVAALIEGRVDPAWARWVRPWTLAAWCFLTIGISLGSWWAYYELGWGGFWFWDPVENASFMPWLAGTALLHSAIVVERRDTLKAWTILLAILTFSLSLLGTFIVRSGVLTSVHAFATDPARGLFILGFLVVAIGGSLALFAVRAPALRPGGLFAPVSREGALVLNNILLATACATVLLGTLYPLILDAISGEKVSVGPPFFQATFVPLMLPLLAAMAVGPLLPWKRGDLRGALERLRFTFIFAGFTGLAVYALVEPRSAAATGGVALAAWLVLGGILPLYERTLRGGVSGAAARLAALPRSAIGMSLAHAGVGLVVLGLTVLLTWQTEKDQVMRVGETMDVAGYTLTLRGVASVAGPNYVAQRATFDVAKGGEVVMRLAPEKRSYVDSPQVTTEAAIEPTWLGDLYVVVGDADGNGGYAIRGYFKPFVHWLWIGAAVMVAGGLVSLSDRRHRVGAPAARRTRETGALAGAASGATE
ncbi:MAG: heme lyase CcmF/NrfE family subunit [Alphaproteobacteria bacterium]|nr:heme lyase CcmF/NrfE family subunit [Alphaproteobacteria bacterium]